MFKKYLLLGLFFSGFITQPIRSMFSNRFVTLTFHTIVPLLSVIIFVTEYEDSLLKISIFNNHVKKISPSTKIRHALLNFIVYNSLLLGYFSLMSGDQKLGKLISFSIKNKNLVLCCIFLPTNLILISALLYKTCRNPK